MRTWLQRRREHGLRLGETVEKEALASHHLAVADREDLDGGALSLHVGGEEVALLEVGGRDLLGRLEPLERAYLVAHRGGLLEALLGRHAPHVGAQAAHHLLRPPLEEEPRVLARPAVAVERADPGHAGRDAPLDLVLEARARPSSVQGLLAGADAEQLPDEAGGLPAQAGRDVRAAVHVAVLRGPAHHVEPRVLLGERQLEIGVVLVVAQADVVHGLVALDQVVLERQGLHLGVGHDEVEVGDLLDHPALVELGRTGGLEVGPHAVADHPGLADVDHPSARVPEQVDAGAQRELAELLRQAPHTRL